MNKTKRITIFERFKHHNPTPETELEYQNHFQLLIAVLLSAQATDKSVNKATHTLFQSCFTPEDLLNVGLEKFTQIISSLNLYKTKAKHALETAYILKTQFNSQVPENRKDLESLPGVGRKTANVVLNVAFKQMTMAVDTHIFRVSNRTKIAPGKDVLEVEQKLLKFVPKDYLLNAHHWLILHGRYICKARKPECWQCYIEDLCEFKEKTPLPK